MMGIVGNRLYGSIVLQYMSKSIIWLEIDFTIPPPPSPGSGTAVHGEVWWVQDRSKRKKGKDWRKEIR